MDKELFESDIATCTYPRADFPYLLIMAIPVSSTLFSLPTSLYEASISVGVRGVCGGVGGANMVSRKQCI